MSKLYPYTSKSHSFVLKLLLPRLAEDWAGVSGVSGVINKVLKLSVKELSQSMHVWCLMHVKLNEEWFILSYNTDL